MRHLRPHESSKTSLRARHAKRHKRRLWSVTAPIQRTATGSELRRRPGSWTHGSPCQSGLRSPARQCGRLARVACEAPHITGSLAGSKQDTSGSLAARASHWQCPSHCCRSQDLTVFHDAVHCRRRGQGKTHRVPCNSRISLAVLPITAAAVMT